MTDLNDIAAQVKEGFAKDLESGWEVTTQLFTNPVEIAHRPAEDIDGPVDAIAAGDFKRATARHLPKVPNFTYTYEVEAKGQQIIEVLHFNLEAGGQPFVFKGILEYHFNDEGKIEKMVGIDDPETLGLLRQAIAEAGPSMPSPWRDRPEA